MAKGSAPRVLPALFALRSSRNAPRTYLPTAEKLTPKSLGWNLVGQSRPPVMQAALVSESGFDASKVVRQRALVTHLNDPWQKGLADRD